MTHILSEEQFGNGAIHTEDSRDIKYSDIAFSSTPFDWNVGFDIEQQLGHSLTPKDQGGSGSCGGQAWSMYQAVLEAMSTKSFEERSAKFIYAQTHVPGGGSDGRTNSKLCVSQGVSTEALCPSYPATESFMEKASDITQAAKDNAKTDKALTYASVDCNIDAVAQAVRDNNGCVIGITGMNNGTWLSKFPLPPAADAPGNSLWFHWVYVGKAKMIDGKKYIGFINSWGSTVGENGWQYVPAEYFINMLHNYYTGAIFQVFTMVYNPQTVTPTPSHVFSKTLKYGMRDAEVMALQGVLKNLGFFPTTQVLTTYFGAVTRGAVQKFQTAHGLVADGVVGAKTNAVLNSIK